jgi:cell division protein FtsB
MRKRNYLRSTGRLREARRTRLFILAGVLAGVYFLTTFVFGEMGLVKYYRMKAQYNALLEETETLKQENVQLLRDVRALKTDPAVIERLARDKLGLARDGEIVYYYGQPVP